MQRITLVTVSTAAILMTLGVSGTAKANSCKSEWIKAQELVAKSGPKVAQGVCQFFNKNDEQGAQKCVEDYEKFKTKFDQAVGQINKGVGDSPMKIGPRPLGNKVWKSGNLTAQRTFIGSTILSETHRLDLERTSKGRADINVKVCYLDKDGNERKKRSFSLKRHQNKTTITEAGVDGLYPVVLLSSKVGFGANKYKIRGEVGQGEPKRVKDARKVLARSSGGNGGGNKLSGRTFLIQNVHSGKAMDASAPKKGANIHQWAIHNRNNQRWTLKPQNGGTFSLVSKANGMCLDLQWANKNEGGNVFLWPCAQNAWNMSYEFRPTGKPNEYTIYNRGSNKCLEVEKWYGHNGGNIVQRSCTNNPNQKWRLQPR